MADRPHRPARVTLIGAESTGKTTLARLLAVHYKTVWAPEYLRAFVCEKGALPKSADSRRIAEGHLAQEASLHARARRVLFLDTDLYSTLVYHRYYFGTSSAWLQRQARKHAADLYLFTDTDIPFVADEGQRDGPTARAALRDLFLQELLDEDLRHAILRGTLKRRLSAATVAVDRYLAARYLTS